jgi:predicted MFS family arabinose efflux permease
MLMGMVALIVSQVMFMEAPTYVVMCIARILQGFSSSVIWVVGLAYLYAVFLLPVALIRETASNTPAYQL